MLILCAKIALNAVICMILFIFFLDNGNVGFHCSFLQFYVLRKLSFLTSISDRHKQILLLTSKGYKCQNFLCEVVIRP